MRAGRIPLSLPFFFSRYKLRSLKSLPLFPFRLASRRFSTTSFIGLTPLGRRSVGRSAAPVSRQSRKPQMPFVTHRALSRAGAAGAAPVKDRAPVGKGLYFREMAIIISALH
jgi:hypothetical protein